MIQTLVVNKGKLGVIKNKNRLVVIVRYFSLLALDQKSARFLPNTHKDAKSPNSKQKRVQQIPASGRFVLKRRI